MGELVDFNNGPRLGPRLRHDKRRFTRAEYVHGQQVLANAIFHWKSDPAKDARAAVRFLMHHLATAFRADDTPLQPHAVEKTMPTAARSAPEEDDAQTDEAQI